MSNNLLYVFVLHGVSKKYLQYVCYFMDSLRNLFYMFISPRSVTEIYSIGTSRECPNNLLFYMFVTPLSVQYIYSSRCRSKECPNNLFFMFVTPWSFQEIYFIFLLLHGVSKQSFTNYFLFTKVLKQNIHISTKSDWITYCFLC